LPYDFGVSIEKMSIWHEGLNLNYLRLIYLTDAVCDWNEEYQLLVQMKRTTHECYQNRQQTINIRIVPVYYYIDATNTRV